MIQPRNSCRADGRFPNSTILYFQCVPKAEEQSVQFCNQHLANKDIQSSRQISTYLNLKAGELVAGSFSLSTVRILQHLGFHDLTFQFSLGMYTLLLVGKLQLSFIESSVLVFFHNSPHYKAGVANMIKQANRSLSNL